MAFSLEEKLAIARGLDALGMPELEVGIPVNGEIIAVPGDEGEIERLLRDADDIEALSGIAYRVHFAGRTLLVPERSLAAFETDA